MRSIEGRMRSSADTQPSEMWARAVNDATEPIEAEVNNTDVLYGDDVMTVGRVEAIRRVGQTQGESGQRLMRLVGIDPTPIIQ